MYSLTCAPNEDSNQPAQWSNLIRVFLVHLKKIASLAIQNLPSEDSDPNAQSDLNLRRALRYVFLRFGSFSFDVDIVLLCEISSLHTLCIFFRLLMKCFDFLAIWVVNTDKKHMCHKLTTS